MLTLGAPWGLLALAAIPAVVALHLFRRRFRPRRVGALFLWGSDMRSAGGGRTRQPLRNRLSLWCEIAACLAFAWFLADPHLTSSRDGRHLLLVADSRWSLQAHDHGASAWDRVRNAAHQRLAGLAPGDRATLIATGRVPRLIAGPAATPTEVAAALDRLQPDQPDHAATSALSLAARLGGPGGEVVLLSDRVPVDLPRGAGAIAGGVRIPTSGWADADWSVRRGEERITARLTACGSPVQRAWRISAGDRMLAQGRIEAAPGASSLITIPVHDWPVDQVALSLGGDDPLPIDDTCILRRPPPRRLAARIDLPDDAKALRMAVTQAMQAAGDVTLVTTIATQLEVGTTADAVPPPGTWRLVFAPGDGPVQLGPFLARTGHAFLDGLDTNGLVWTGSAASPLPDETPLLTAGGRVLLGERRHPGAHTLFIHGDPSRSQLLRHPAWPALVANWCERRRSALPGPERSTVRRDQPLAVQCAATGGLALTAPDGVTVRMIPDSDGRVVLEGLDRIGTWMLASGSTRWPVEVVALDARLADLAEAVTTVREPVPVGTSATRHEAPPLSRLLPLLIAAAALVLAWQAYRNEGGT